MNGTGSSNAERAGRPPVKYRTVATALLILMASGGVPSRGDEPPKAPKDAGDAHVRGQLQFKSRKADFEGTDVGKEFDKRKYIAGSPNSSERGVWNFDTLPRGAISAPGDVVAAKFTCSTFHLAQAPPGGVQVVIRVVSHTCPQVPPDPIQRGEWQWVRDNDRAEGKKLRDKYQDDAAAYRAKKADPEDAKLDTEGWKAVNALAEKYGYHELRLPKVLDGVETSIDLPAGLFRNALKNNPETDADGKPKRPLVSVYVKCETVGVLLGMTEPDLYLVEPKAGKR